VISLFYFNFYNLYKSFRFQFVIYHTRMIWKLFNYEYLCPSEPVWILCRLQRFNFLCTHTEYPHPHGLHFLSTPPTHYWSTHRNPPGQSPVSSLSLTQLSSVEVAHFGANLTTIYCNHNRFVFANFLIVFNPLLRALPQGEPQYTIR